MRQRQAQITFRCLYSPAALAFALTDYRHLITGCRYVIEAEMPKVCISKLSVALDDWQEELDNGFTTQLAYRPLTAGSQCRCLSLTCIASQCSPSTHCSYCTTLLLLTDSLSFTAAVQLLQVRCGCWQLSDLALFSAVWLLQVQCSCCKCSVAAASALWLLAAL